MLPDTTLIVALIGGLILLAFAGDFLVSGAVRLGRQAGLSPLISGIFIVGFGTSAPEMIVAFDAARSGYPSLALGNIVGSNIANILLVMAVPAIIAPVIAGGWGQGRAWFAMLLATAAWIAILTFEGLNIGIGTLFIAALLLYALYTLISARVAAKAGVDIGMDEVPPRMGIGQAMGRLLIGLIGLPIGANLIVDSGQDIAEFYKISPEIVGITLLAVGTSLPEIAAGISAALRNKTDVLVGNVLGSNIFNILGAGGLISFFGPIKAPIVFTNYDHWVMAASAVLVGLFIFAKARMGRMLGIIILLIYSIYIYGVLNGWNILGLING